MELGEIINVVTKEIIDNGKYMFMSIVNIGNKLHFYKWIIVINDWFVEYFRRIGIQK